MGGVRLLTRQGGVLLALAIGSSDPAARAERRLVRNAAQHCWVVRTFPERRKYFGFNASIAVETLSDQDFRAPIWMRMRVEAEVKPNSTASAVWLADGGVEGARD